MHRNPISDFKKNFFSFYLSLITIQKTYLNLIRLVFLVCLFKLNYKRKLPFVYADVWKGGKEYKFLRNFHSSHSWVNNDAKMKNKKLTCFNLCSGGSGCSIYFNWVLQEEEEKYSN